MGIKKYDFTSLGDGGICWTTTPYRAEALKELPSIEMYGYQQEWSTTITSIQTWWTRFKEMGEGGNPYKNLYAGKAVSFYKLPYFSENHHSISQSWGGNQGLMGSGIESATKFMETVSKTFLPAAGILTPKSWEGGEAESYSFTFNLINTNMSTGDAGQKNNTVWKNQLFLESFISDNLHGQNGVMSIVPPLIYEVYIPGIRWSPAAYVSSLGVKNKGAMNNNLGGIIPGASVNYIYPDAWEVTVTISELIKESKTLYRDATTGAGYASSITTRSFS
jgi:hypothetical protein